MEKITRSNFELFTISYKFQFQLLIQEKLSKKLSLLNNCHLVTQPIAVFLFDKFVSFNL